MSTEREAVLLVGVSAKQAHTLANTELSFDDYVCLVQEETGWILLEDEGLFGNVDLMPDSYTLDSLLYGVGDTMTMKILEEVELLKGYFGEVTFSITPCVYSY